MSVSEVGPIQPLKPKVPNPSMLAVKITSLSAGHQYRFYVWARTKAGRSRDPSFVDVVMEDAAGKILAQELFIL